MMETTIIMHDAQADVIELVNTLALFKYQN